MGGKFISAVARGGAVALLSVGAVGAAAPNVFAEGYGNTVHNCYGIYWNTDWDQRCWSGGARNAGQYQSTSDCTFDGDETLNRYRSIGSTTSYDGEDCIFEVVGVDTVFR
ncbi:hypothetical protein IM697_37245 [Streptomyces ferrugineus]|uniref:Uncharacterized protein n=1 Tax=Streptomyces ferrugineus TaxID=1413221 RepID=A0A7M2SH58_9ACTN|nr:hypothetical protein [Streptomyces ferrugineus]QOV35644.1 hypothetical protein IM697_37245 [Streptomyces ferrugineus]